MNLESNPKSRVLLYFLGAGTLLVSFMIWSMADRLEFNITPETRLNKRMQIAVRTCKTGAWLINGDQFVLRDGISNTPSNTAVLTYERRAARGLVDSDNYADIACLFTLKTAAGDPYTYVGLQKGESNNAYRQTGALQIGGTLQVQNFVIAGNRIRIDSLESRLDPVTMVKHTFLNKHELGVEGDELVTLFSTTTRVTK